AVDDALEPGLRGHRIARQGEKLVPLALLLGDGEVQWAIAELAIQIGRRELRLLETLLGRGDERRFDQHLGASRELPRLRLAGNFWWTAVLRSCYRIMTHSKVARKPAKTNIRANSVTPQSGGPRPRIRFDLPAAADGVRAPARAARGHRRRD